MGPPKKIEDALLPTVLDENDMQTQQQMAYGAFFTNIASDRSEHLFAFSLTSASFH